MYQLEIYMPGSAKDVGVGFTSDSPFMAIQIGDILNPGSWDGEVIPGTSVLRVVNVEHIIWNSKAGTKHKLCVFTEEIDDTPEARLTRR